MSSIMIDIETLGRRNDAAIREVGLVAFNSDGTIISKRQLSVAPDVWNTCGRTFSGETVIWLLANPNIDTDFNCHSYSELISHVNEFVSSHLTIDGYIWSKGHMDIEVLKDLYETINIPLPWEFWQPRDLRTILDLAGDNVAPQTHRAIEDAEFQTDQLIRILASIKTTLNQ
ncbi:hypothetical protein E4T81_12370 [Barnesiella sp. WM24]|uniref:3'-5' exonuclease n=1 Tax=Barnesiella sp. WM24 TaxID=2558278 RepID=UPI001072DF30|nr:3'-5' exonuclease [Barnesiella sp. WM24]TFU92377.1 hypothetical protein E4T81_12370 [Barnesiella sp. WM24]